VANGYFSFSRLFKEASKYFAKYFISFVLILIKVEQRIISMASISTTTPLALPNLSYHPNFEQYQLRAKLQLLSEESTQDLPDRYPKRLDSALVWEGKDVNTPEKQQEWLLHLSGEQLNEINRALRHFQGLFSPLIHFSTDCSGFPALEKPLGFISPSTFPLPTLLSVLRLTSYNIHFGRGFAVLRGLDVDSYSREENIIIYAGISSHIGSIRGRQDNFHNGKPADVVLAHIQNFDRTTEKKGYGLAACTIDNVVFHTDVGDIVSLLALQEAATGGESLLASSGRVYNELVETRPDLIKTLAEDWVIDRWASAALMQENCSDTELMLTQTQWPTTIFREKTAAVSTD
jgi:hypothetical protein